MAIELTGVKEMQARMLSLRMSLGGPSMVKAVRSGANVIKKEMIVRTPILIEHNAGSTALEPGSVKRDISVRLPASENRFQVTALIGPGKRAARVAHLVEYGHRMVTGGRSRVLANGKIQGNGKVHDQDVPAYPFLRPAFEASLAGVKEAMVQTMETELRKAVK